MTLVAQGLIRAPTVVGASRLRVYHANMYLQDHATSHSSTYCLRGVKALECTQAYFESRKRHYTQQVPMFKENRSTEFGIS